MKIKSCLVICSEIFTDKIVACLHNPARVSFHNFAFAIICALYVCTYMYYIKAIFLLKLQFVIIFAIVDRKLW